MWILQIVSQFENDNAGQSNAEFLHCDIRWRKQHFFTMLEDKSGEKLCIIHNSSAPNNVSHPQFIDDGVFLQETQVTIPMLNG
ncbi:unnamed protein product [Rhodiola kirilowii]